MVNKYIAIHSQFWYYESGRQNFRINIINLLKCFRRPQLSTETGISPLKNAFLTLFDLKKKINLNLA